MKTQKDRLNKIINDSGMTKTKFADKLDIHRQTIYDLSSGRQKKIPIDLAQKIQEILQINTNWLLTGEGEILLSKPQVPENDTKELLEMENKYLKCQVELEQKKTEIAELKLQINQLQQKDQKKSNVNNAQARRL